MAHPTCVLDGCEKPSRSKSPAMCKMHYHRWYRHGDPNMVATGMATKVDVGKYLITELPHHPVAGPSGKAYVHRVVLFDSIGPGYHSCHWCERAVTWDKPSTDPDGLQVDHLNGRRDDNRIDNLVPCCGGCNGTRAQQARADALRAAGLWSRNDTVQRLASPGRLPRIEATRPASRISSMTLAPGGWADPP